MELAVTVRAVLLPHRVRTAHRAQIPAVVHGAVATAALLADLAAEAAVATTAAVAVVAASMVAVEVDGTS